MLFTMFLQTTGLVVAVFLQNACPIPISQGIYGNNPDFKCLENFDLSENTQERLFKVTKCSQEYPFQVDCGKDILDQIDNFTKEFPQLKPLPVPENFDYFYKRYKEMWKIMSSGLNHSREEGSGLCWDVPAMGRMLSEFRFLNSYLMWSSNYADVVVIGEVIFGLLANSVVLAIIIRFKQMKTQANLIILNLVIADTLQLLSFTATSSLLYLLPVTVILNSLCNCLVYIVTFSCTCSVYSMVALSFLRYMAISAVPGSKAFTIMQDYVKIPLVMAMVWVTSAVASTPYMVDFSENCAPSFEPSLQILGFLLFCFLPLVLIAAFTCGTRSRLRKSVRQIPGREGPRLESEVWARERGANIILALCIVFGITFVPPTVGSLVSTLSAFRYNNASYFHQILFLLNTCINPVALFVTSDAFRKHFKLLLPSWVVEKRQSSAT